MVDNSISLQGAKTRFRRPIFWTRILYAPAREASILPSPVSDVYHAGGRYYTIEGSHAKWYCTRYGLTSVQISEAFKPTLLEIHNDSHLHAHHKAMQNSLSKETHFRIVIVSEAFQSKIQPARHRMIYNLLKEEMSKEGGIHALQLRTRTPMEEQKMASANGS